MPASHQKEQRELTLFRNRGTGTVSYTHLDVYKRQDRGKLAMDAYKTNLKQTANQEVPKTFRTVSYTHLAVSNLSNGSRISNSIRLRFFEYLLNGFVVNPFKQNT